MACEVCEHCNTPVKAEEVVTKEGYSYHKDCRKCYVCSENNLENAEIFKGVIFCYGCAKRIFQGCSSARKEKMRRQKRHRARKTRNRVIELARVNSIINSDSSKLKISNSQSTDNTMVTNKTYTAKALELKSMNKSSIDMATTTDVTQELLETFFSAENNKENFPPAAKPRRKRKSYKKNKRKNVCSDMRIAELGTSTEIAHVTLRGHSEVPVVIKSESKLKELTSKELSFITQESESSGDYTDESSYESKDVMKTHWLDRRIGSILKLPYKSFKRSILDRSSVISAIMNDEESSECFLRRFKTMFREEITEHQRRGLRRLFSTINQKKIPYKLGWLQVLDKIPEDRRVSNSFGTSNEKRCRHFRTSHSYRCMRNQVMRLAGPTRSELTVMRRKLKDILCFQFLRKVVDFNKQFVQIITSQG